MIKILFKLLMGDFFRLNFGGGGDSKPTQNTTTGTTYTQSLSPELVPYATDIAQRAQAESAKEYTPYGQERIAGFSPMQQQSFGNIQGMQTSPLNFQAAGMSGQAGLGGLYAGQNYNQMATNPYATQAFMSPYQQMVTDYQKESAIRDYGRGLPGQQAQASRAGAFGGSRHAIVEAEGQRNLQNQLAGIQATGSQNAFQNAQQAQQFGANLGLQGLGLANQSANQMGQMGQQEYAQQMGINQAQQTAGATQQAQTQQGLTQAYNDFVNQKNFPTQQLNAYSALIRGLAPVSPYQSASTPPPPNLAGQISGLAATGIGALSYGSGSGSGKG
jgi:hypothetical protein